jgi:hypothetical protein
MVRFGLMGLLLLSACGRPAEQDARSGTPAQPGAEATAASARPDYLPDYPGSTPVEIPNLGAPGTDSRSGNAVARETDATPAEVAAFYRARFAAAGVPLRADSMTGSGGLLAVGRDGEMGAMLTITQSGGRTRVTIIRRSGAR